ncbi:beta-agarase [Flavobacterium sp. ARAG 55.4]|uniref:beta-agarase n=1 Tax=Flavobacterium sp. ARAG 55.4 TaxID=3451357 RepID=UPI003F45FB8F
MRFSTFKFQVIILLLGLAHGQLYAQPTPPEGKKWIIEKSLSDEFNGSFDTNKWSKSTWNYKNTPCEMVTQNAGVSDGNMWIKATLSEKDSLWFKTARVQSKSKISFPMYTECRIKAANISAYTTYWLNNGNANSRDEIDICENNPKPSIAAQTKIRPYTLYSQYFIVKNGVTERNHSEEQKRRPDTRNLSDKNPAKGKKWNEDYQVLGCYWKDSKNVQFYINGEPAGSTNSKQDFSLDLNIIWDLWTGPFDYLGGLAIKEDLKNSQWNTMYVDWIHTYKLENIKN